MKKFLKSVAVGSMFVSVIGFSPILNATNNPSTAEISSTYDRGKELWSGNAVKWVREETNNRKFWDPSQTIYIVVYRDSDGDLTAYYKNRPLTVYSCSRNNQGYTHYVSVDNSDWYFKLH